MRIYSAGRQKGFTLIELLITIAIVAILSSLAYTSYSSSTTKARRTDAQTALISFGQAMERHKTENGGYATATAGAVPAAPIIFPTQAPLDGGIKYYDLTVEAVSDANSTYTLRATPIVGGGQAGDGFLEIMSTGVRRWDKNDDGDADDAGENCWEVSC